ncbi:MAG: hypothetical protein JSU77_06785 [Fidelibacterota bacterium]|nr:MAG: hypothetical protein JSU77_06785 [Candidatus Neomarinimicrobiota bacterium]
MTAAAESRETIHIRGAPPHLSAVLPLRRPVSGPVSASVDLPKKVAEMAPLSARVSLLGHAGLTHLHLKLPRNTPPGAYQGAVEIEDQRKLLIVEVEPRARIRVIPKRATIQSQAGKTADLKITLINMGNVALEVPKTSSFCIYQQRGVDLAIGRTFQAELDKNERRIDRLMEELREGYGGVVKLKIKMGAGKLEPGDARDLDIVLQLPAQVVAGCSYWGSWPLFGYNFKIDIEITPENKKSPEKSKES